jgi:hypothetical protein
MDIKELRFLKALLLFIVVAMAVWGVLCSIEISFDNHSGKSYFKTGEYCFMQYSSSAWGSPEGVGKETCFPVDMTMKMSDFIFTSCPQEIAVYGVIGYGELKKDSCTWVTAVG